MTDPVFRATARLTRSITVAVTLTLAVYSDVRCPTCKRLVMTVPGAVVVQPVNRATQADCAGHGPVASCKRCGSLVEAIVREAA